jgi:hypothetical protein
VGSGQPATLPMNPVCSLSDSFRGARSLFPSVSLMLCVLGVPRAAAAQAAGPRPPTEEAPRPAEPTPAAGVAPAGVTPASPGGPSSEPAEPTPEEPKKHKKRKKEEDEAAEAEAAQPDAPRNASDRPDKAGKPPKAKPDVELKGRVFGLTEVSHRNETVVGSTGTLETRDRNALDLSLQSARFGINYRSPLRFLSLQLELEVAGKPQVKDAFLEAGKTFFVKAGQFKVPSATFELESPWTLPLVRRGLVHDLMTDWLDIAGRRPGVALGYKSKAGLKPRLTLGAFQGTTLEQVVPGDRDVRLIDHASLTAQTYAARAEITLAMVTLGAWYEQRVGSTVAAAFSHFATFGLDAEVSQRFEHGALRAWVDGSAGESLYVHADKPASDSTPWFASGRALVGYRFGGLELGAPYVEPFGFFAVLDPDTEVVADMVTEAAVGVAAGFWDRARLTLQAEVTDAKRNFPAGFLDSQTPDHMSLLLQAGARF